MEYIYPEKLQFAPHGQFVLPIYLLWEQEGLSQNSSGADFKSPKERI